MQPRLNMAIKLTDEAKWPKHLTKPLRSIRKAVQGGIGEGRNIFVHGVHEALPEKGEFALTMIRLSPPKRRQIVSILDVADLISRIRELVNEAERVFRGYGVWQFGPDHKDDCREQIAQTKAMARFIRAQNIKRALKLLLANLKPW